MKYLKYLKNSEKYCNLNIKHTKWNFQQIQHGSKRISNQYGIESNKIRYKVPKTWSKTISIIFETWKNNPRLRRESLIYSTMITIGFFGVTIGFFKFLQMFGPGGSGQKWRQSIWNQVAGRDTDKDFQQMEQESYAQTGYIKNMFNVGVSPRMDSMDKRAREQLSKEKYKAWNDIWNKGFPKTAEEYKRASKLRPETMEDWEIMQELKNTNNNNNTTTE